MSRDFASVYGLGFGVSGMKDGEVSHKRNEANKPVMSFLETEDGI